MAHTLEDMRTCIKRELDYRAGVYERRIRNKTMTKAEAAREVSRMKSVMALLQAIADAPQSCPHCRGPADAEGHSVFPKPTLF